MTGYLLDTSVLSILAPDRPDASPQLLGWIGERDTELHVSTISIAEVEQGIAKLERLGSTRKLQSMRLWLDRTLILFADRILPVDVAVARVAGRISDAAFAAGSNPGIADILIAATGEAHGLRLLTRNLKHFTPLGIGPLDPTVRLPD